MIIAVLIWEEKAFKKNLLNFLNQLLKKLLKRR